ncbi:MAG: FUSC family protein [Candidatus Binataceae bacterium]
MAAAPSRELPRDALPGGRLEAILASLAEEFALRPHRLRSALRAATIGALGAGLMAAAHVDTNLGPYIVWLLAGTPTAMLRWRVAIVFTLIEGATIALAIVLGRLLSQSPTLMLAMVAVFGALSTYVIGRFNLGSFGIVTQVLVFDNLYSVMFAPGQIGASGVATFGGLVLGVGLIALFDNWFWPDPAEVILVESLTDNLRRIRTSLIRNARYYVAEASLRGPPPLTTAHDLSSNLTLLARAQTEGISAHRRGVLIAAMTRLSRLRSLANQLAIASDPQIAREVRRLVAPEIRAAIDTIGAALDDLVDNPAAMLRTGPDQSPSPAASRMQSAVAALDARVMAVRPSYLATTGVVELSNFSFFLTRLRGVCRLVERPLDESSAAAGPAAPSSAKSRDPATVRYCLKVAAGLVVGYIIGLTSQRPDLSTIMTTVIITALPTYGAAARKMILRLAGSILGGAIVVLMVTIVSPNFETLPAYVMAIFIALVLSGYAGQGSGRIAYAGKQIGTTVMLAFAGLAPSVAVEAPLWRVWGILLGTAIVLVVSLALWPEYAGDSLLPRLRQLLRLTLALAPGAAADATAIRGLESELNGVLEQTLAVADDARLEGRASKLNADAVVQVAGSLRRIAHRFEGIALYRIAFPRRGLDAETENLVGAALGAIVAQLELWRVWIERPTGVASAPPDAQAHQTAMAQAISELSTRIEADNFARLRDWLPEQRRTLFAELESIRRLSVLMGELDDALARLAAQ